MLNSILSGADSTYTKSSVSSDACGGSSANLNTSSLASTAVSFAYLTKDEAVGNNGTDAYIAAHDACFPGDTYYQSCDRCVATAIVSSGVDTTYIKGSTSGQYKYLTKSDQWEEVSWSGTVDDLQPGDVLIIQGSERENSEHGHTVLYVGNETVKSVYSDADDSKCFVEASYGDYSPYCSSWRAEFTNYHVFRHK